MTEVPLVIRLRGIVSDAEAEKKELQRLEKEKAEKRKAEKTAWALQRADELLPEIIVQLEATARSGLTGDKCKFEDKLVAENVRTMLTCKGLACGTISTDSDMFRYSDDTPEVEVWTYWFFAHW